MPYTPQQNAIAKRRNQTLFNMIRYMMSYLEMSLQFWGETLSAVTYILNRVYTNAKSLTPYNIRTGTKSDLSKLKV